MSEKRKCEKQIWSDHRSYACRNSAKVEREGKWYCGVHDPVAVQRKRKSREAKWQAEWEAQQKKWDAQKRRREAGELGIELARFIVSKWHEGFLLETLSLTHTQLIKNAQAVIDKLEKAEETCQRKKS